MRISRFVAVTLVAAQLVTGIAEAAPPPPPPPPTQPVAASAPDEVHLVDGGFVKGEILELVNGEYVIIKPLVGDARRFEWDQVASVERQSADAAPSWHMRVNGQTIGPITDTELRRRYKSGEITRTTSVWKEGMNDWVKLETLSKFSDLWANEAVAPVEPKPTETPKEEGPKLASVETPYIHMELSDANRGSVTLQRVTERAVAVGSDGGSASAVAWKRACTSPCDKLIEMPGDEFFVTGPKIAGSRPFVIGESAPAYELKVKVRGKGMVIGGWVLATVGPLAFIPVVIIPIFVNMKQGAGIAMWTLGGVGMAGSIAGGFVMMRFGRSKVEVFPRDQTFIPKPTEPAATE